MISTDDTALDFLFFVFSTEKKTQLGLETGNCFENFVLFSEFKSGLSYSKQDCQL